MSTRPLPAASTTATAQRVADVSMTKITNRPDEAAVAAQLLDLDEPRAVDFDALAPLHDNGSLLRELLEAEVAQLRHVLDAVKVHVRQLHAAGIDANQLEGRARHGRLRARALRHAADEGRLARAELAGQEHYIPG